MMSDTVSKLYNSIEVLSAAITVASKDMVSESAIDYFTIQDTNPIDAKDVTIVRLHEEEAGSVYLVKQHADILLPKHFHLHSVEHFIVLSGSVLINHTEIVNAGGSCVIERGQSHYVEALKDSKYVVILHPCDKDLLHTD